LRALGGGFGTVLGRLLGAVLQVLGAGVCIDRNQWRNFEINKDGGDEHMIIHNVRLSGEGGGGGWNIHFVDLSGDGASGFRVKLGSDIEGNSSSLGVVKMAHDDRCAGHFTEVDEGSSVDGAERIAQGVRFRNLDPARVVTELTESGSDRSRVWRHNSNHL